jgi:hypothetical protein
LLEWRVSNWAGKRVPERGLSARSMMFDDVFAGPDGRREASASVRSVKRIFAAYWRDGEALMRKDRRPEARRNSVMPGDVVELEKIVQDQPDLFLDEIIRERLHERTRVLYGLGLVAKTLRLCGYTWKVLARIAAQRDAEQRRACRAKIATVDARCLLFIDESHHEKKNKLGAAGARAAGGGLH